MRLSLIHIYIISLNDNSVLVEGKLYKKNEVVKTIRTDIEGIASTSADLLPYGNFRIVESEAPNEMCIRDRASVKLPAP